MSMSGLLSKENGSFMSSWIKYPEKFINLCSSFNAKQMAKYSKYLPLICNAGNCTIEEESMPKHLYDFKEFLKYWGLKANDKAYGDPRNGHVLTETFNLAFPFFVEYRNNMVLLLDMTEDYLAACRRHNEFLIAVWKETSEKLAGNSNDYINEIAEIADSVISELRADTGRTEDKQYFADASLMASAVINLWSETLKELIVSSPLYGSRDDIIKIKSDIADLRKKIEAMSDDETKAEILSLLKKDIKMMRTSHNSDVQNILNAIAALRVDILGNKNADLKDRIKAA